MKQKGFAHLIILVVVLLILVSLVVFYFMSKSDKKLPVPHQISVQNTPIPPASPTPTPSPWKIYKNDKYGFELTYPKEGVALGEKSYEEVECGKFIKEGSGKIDVDNFFQVKVVEWVGTIQDYLISQRAGKIYDTEIITGTGADEGLYLVGFKKD